MRWLLRTWRAWSIWWSRCSLGSRCSVLGLVPRRRNARPSRPSNAPRPARYWLDPRPSQTYEACGVLTVGVGVADDAADVAALEHVLVAVVDLLELVLAGGHVLHFGLSAPLNRPQLRGGIIGG